MWFYSFDVTDEQVVRISARDNVIAQWCLKQLEQQSEHCTRLSDPTKAVFVVRGYGTSNNIPVLVAHIQRLFQEVILARES